MAEKFIFHMHGVNKSYGQKQVLKGINLSFFPGAKIGIVGENGSGKTTVLRIMAGLEKEVEGHAEITPGFRSGMVAQEPELDETLTVRETIESAFGEILTLTKEYDRVAESMGEGLDDDAMDKEAQQELEELDEPIIVV